MPQLLRTALYVTVVCALGLWLPVHAADTTLPEAAMASDEDAVRALLTNGADVNAAQGDGMTALHWSAIRNDVEVAALLIGAGANVDATTRLGGYTPLLLAAKVGSSGMIEALVTAGADPNLSTTNGTTPLMLAAASGSVDGVNTLLDQGVAVNAGEVKKQTALMFAAAYGRTDAIRALTARGADVTMTSEAVDLLAAGTAREAGEARGGRGASDYNTLIAGLGGLTPLHLAARQGHLEAVKVLLAAGADVNQPTSAPDKTPPLLIATINGHFDLAKLLLDRGADPRASSENGITALFAALNCQWAPRAAYPQPQAHLQQRTTYLDLMTALLDKGADPNARANKKPWYSGYNFDRSGISEGGATAFWRAAYASDIDAMRLLVARGADPHIWTMKMPGRAGAANETQRAVGIVESAILPVPIGGPDVSPLHAAAGVGYGVGYSGNSHRFAPSGQLAAVKYLVEELHMDVNAVDAMGNNAVHHAASRGDTEMVLYLVSKGADPLLVNREGLTTVDMANAPVQKTTPFPDTIAVLEKMGATNNHRCMSC